MINVFLARQPIFSRSQDVFAYEIFYRSGYTNHYIGTDPDKASSQVILSTFQFLGLESITAGKPAFINFSDNLLKEGVATLFPKEHLVVEILESVELDEQILEKCRQLKAAGYTIVLDDFVYRPEHLPLLDLADIVKIDFMASDRQQLENDLSKLRGRDVTLLAEKVETWDDFRCALDLGFDLFQGYFFSRPELIASKEITPLQLNYLALVAELNEPELNFDELASIVSQDLSFTYSLLRLVNSAAYARRHYISSVKHALVILGERELKKWVALMALQRMSTSRPEGPITTSLVRARFIELLAQHTEWSHRKDELYLGGLFSLLDVLLQRPLVDILDELQLAPDINEMLLRGTGNCGDLWSLMLAYERGDWDSVESWAFRLGMESASITQAYVEAIQWAP